jgi:chaperone required for assembly of F1-ATPase
MNMTGKLPGGSVSQENNITLNIKTEQPIDESFVRNKLIPEIEKSLRRLSLDGRRVLSPAGVR